MSSVTDPYQPIDRRLKLTRDILILLAEKYQPRLVIQTRSPLVVRDLDILSKFENIQINMTVTTDSDEVRQAFEPSCPNNRVRLAAIQRVHEFGLPTCITLTPLLPVNNSVQFAKDLRATGIPNFIIQPFHPQRGKFVAGTREGAVRIMEQYDWNEQRYTEVIKVLKRNLPSVGEGKEGFAPSF